MTGPTMNESQVLPTINLSTHQKMVLAQLSVGNSDEGKRLHLTDDKLKTGHDILVKLGIIEFDKSTETSQLTDTANTLMVDAGITDEQGTLTDLGKKFAAGETPDKEDIADNIDSQEGTGSMDDPTLPGTKSESFHISFKNYLRLVE